MLKRNGVGIGIDTFPGRKKLCLYVFDEKNNTGYKVASFNNDESAEFFKQAVFQLLKGLVEEEHHG